jgi:hypothetical protein
MHFDEISLEARTIADLRLELAEAKAELDAALAREVADFSKDPHPGGSVFPH